MDIVLKTYGPQNMASSITEDKEKDAVWEIIGRNDWSSYVEVYTLPTYTGDIANLEGERLSEEDLNDILVKDGAKFAQTGMTQIDGRNWHVGIEMDDEGNAIKITFYQMEDDKGNYHESVLVESVISPLSFSGKSLRTEKGLLYSSWETKGRGTKSFLLYMLETFLR